MAVHVLAGFFFDLLTRVWRRLTLCVFDCLSLFLFVCLSVCVWLSVCLFLLVCLTVCVSGCLPLPLGPDLQNILRQTQEKLRIKCDLGKS